MNGNAIELRLDAIESRLTEMERGAVERSGKLLRSVEAAVEQVLSAHEDNRHIRAGLADVIGRIGRIEALCPECPNRTAPTPPPSGENQ